MDIGVEPFFNVRIGQAGRIMIPYAIANPGGRPMRFRS
jgi:hypothetical protein